MDGGGARRLSVQEEDEICVNTEKEEPWSRHGRWRIPCFLKGGQSNGALMGGGEVLPPLALEVRFTKRLTYRSLVLHPLRAAAVLSWLRNNIACACLADR